ncbi:MAG TPA: hypothetical protein PLZ84_09110, partial [Clostridia bacterium]|nr:hypothetical protein [Clostridia bacterium]
LAATDKELFTFEDYITQTITNNIEKIAESRTEYSIDTMHSYSGKALRVTFGGPEIEEFKLGLSLGMRNWEGYAGARIYINNASAIQGLNMGVYFESRSDTAARYYMHIKSPRLMSIDGSDVSFEKRNDLIVLPAAFRGWLILTFDDVVITSEAGEVTDYFNMKNVISVIFDFDPAGVDIADKSVVIDNIGVYAGAVSTPTLPAETEALQTPSASPTSDVTSVTPTPTPVPTVTPAPTAPPVPSKGSGNAAKAIAIIVLSAIALAAAVYVLVKNKAIFNRFKK